MKAARSGPSLSAQLPSHPPPRHLRVKISQNRLLGQDSRLLMTANNTKVGERNGVHLFIIKFIKLKHITIKYYWRNERPD